MILSFRLKRFSVWTVPFIFIFIFKVLSVPTMFQISTRFSALGFRPSIWSVWSLSVFLSFVAALCSIMPSLVARKQRAMIIVY